MARHDEDLDLGLVHFYRFEDFDAVHARKPYVEEDDVRRVRLNHFQGVQSVFGDADLVALVGKDFFQGADNIFFVVDNEDAVLGQRYLLL